MAQGCGGPTYNRSFAVFDAQKMAFNFIGCHKQTIASILQADWLGRVCTELFAFFFKVGSLHHAIAGICYIGEVFMFLWRSS